MVYGHILISRNSILRRRVLRRASLTVFLHADQKPIERPIIPGRNSWEEMDARFWHCHSWAGLLQVPVCRSICELNASNPVRVLGLRFSVRICHSGVLNGQRELQPIS
jgi:hypothetical protein